MKLFLSINTNARNLSRALTKIMEGHEMLCPCLLIFLNQHIRRDIHLFINFSDH